MALAALIPAVISLVGTGVSAASSGKGGKGASGGAGIDARELEATVEEFRKGSAPLRAQTFDTFEEALRTGRVTGPLASRAQASQENAITQAINSLQGRLSRSRDFRNSPFTGPLLAKARLEAEAGQGSIPAEIASQFAAAAPALALGQGASAAAGLSGGLGIRTTRDIAGIQAFNSLVSGLSETAGGLDLGGLFGGS